MHRCEDYLEIGVQYGFTLGSVAIKNKTGVDPHLMFNPRFSPGVTLHRVTSDVFFANLPREKMYDVVFLDGLHTFWQTARDFINALSHLRPGGIIVVDDVVPSSELAALPQRDDAVQRQSAEGGVVSGEWFGDVWKLPVALKEILKGSIELEVFGYGPCGQAVVRIPNPRQVLEEISEAQLGPYNSLLFSDFFPEEGVVLLPGHSHD